MPVRLRITLLFTATVFTILVVAGAMVYYISYKSRLNFIKTRLNNRAVNIASMLNRSEVFNSRLIREIDTSTSVSVRDKEIQVYDKYDNKIYSYSDRPDTIIADQKILQQAKQKGSFYFIQGKKEAIALFDKKASLVIISATNDESGKKYLLQLKMILLLSLFGGLIFSLGGGYFFSGKLLRPVKNIADEVNEISAKSLTKRIQTGAAKDEWHYLSETLNQLLNRLQESFEMQQRFISNASHELSTPLTSIANQLEVSLQRDRDANHYRGVMQSVHQDVQHINKLMQVLLEFAKASGNAGGLEIEPVRIDEIILRLPAELQKLNPAYHVQPVFDNLPPDQSQLLVFGNEELLFSALKNIVVNACKYSPAHEAYVKLEVLPGLIQVHIIDDGQGISAAEIEKIFQPFYRTPSAETMPGFGLGLSLAAQIIKLHKGKINVSSGPVRGAVFSITLPAAG